ncbi:proteasome assembly chaperone 3 isoform X1 [Aplysia californica]|uniref:Proteasome assembly chaperone 3 isoform X1 n=1 Tax=Aplysia californica TaxID=6500 RepID=A0ABM0JQ69_APLCA|nr:proteasome assembly chaperone 3 isoform X1 [Aplysia californica]
MAASTNPGTQQKSIVTTKQAAADIAGHHTEIVVNNFKDHLFIIATQYMKLGTVVQVTRDLIADEVQGSCPMFSTNVLLGKDEPLTHVMAKTIVAALNPSKDVILSLALKDTTPDTVHAVTDLIKTCLR